MFKLDLEKVEEPEIKLPTSVGLSKKQESSRKHLFLFYWLCQSLWLCASQQSMENFSTLWKWEYQTTWPASWEICMQVKKQQLELDIEKQTGSKSGKEYIKAVYCHPAYLTYMQSTSCEMSGWMSTSWNQDCQEKYQYPQIHRWHHPYGRKQRSKEPLDESERGEWKSWLKTQHS